MSTFTLSASPDTDIWRKPPSKDIFNAPHTQPLTNPLTSFLSATVTVPSNAYTHQYDQSGLLLTFSRSSSPSSGPSGSSPEKWIKAGIELYNGTPRFSVVSCDRWADWSVTPLLPDPSNPDWTTLSIVKEGDEHGISLWVYQVLDGWRRKEPIREICWVFGDSINGGEGWEISVSAMAARPAKGEEKGELKVEGKDLEVKWKE
ncbi:hypothetical protein QBC38DRAFT_151620 [Podospora fimiseda]|uniref:Uncharacterized protein n=1 Tax=Podospora fimiseda TaxID=252190 RepID=A0AAN7BRZ3_9PEZI|nr:hypothetical protein QBC38DRAFT_151620 [Podospora fimiseda]